MHNHSSLVANEWEQKIFFIIILLLISHNLFLQFNIKIADYQNKKLTFFLNSSSSKLNFPIPTDFQL
jgi:cell division protein FtsW (lipid II flippase)